MEHFCVKFSDSSYIGFCDIVWKNRHTDTQTNGCKNPTPATVIGVGNEKLN